MVQRLDHVDGDHYENGNARRKERDPGPLSQNFAAKCYEEGPPYDKNADQIGENFDGDRRVFLQSK